MATGTTTDQDPPEQLQTERRSVLNSVSGLLMAGGLAAAYGTLAAFMARYLYPAKPDDRRWMFVTDIGRLQPGGSLIYRTPAGATVAIARQARTGAVDDFVALSSTCPHLGCQVHWEGQHNRFFCPCHNGAFDPTGKAIAGPPLEGKQNLARYPLRIVKGLLYIEVATAELAAGIGTVERPCGPPGPGHDPCLYQTCRDRREA